MNEVNFGQWLKNTRKEYNMSAQELGGHLGYSQPYVSSVENGNREFNKDKLTMLSEVFNINIKSIEYIYEVGSRKKVVNYDNQTDVTLDAGFKKIIFTRKGKKPLSIPFNSKHMMELQDYFMD